MREQRVRARLADEARREVEVIVVEEDDRVRLVVQLRQQLQSANRSFTAT